MCIDMYGTEVSDAKNSVEVHGIFLSSYIARNLASIQAKTLRSSPIRTEARLAKEIVTQLGITLETIVEGKEKEGEKEAEKEAENGSGSGGGGGGEGGDAVQPDILLGGGVGRGRGIRTVCWLPFIRV